MTEWNETSKAKREREFILCESSLVGSAVHDSIALQLGMERMKSDMRQLGALLAILGIGASFSALSLTAILVEGMTGAQQLDDFRLPVLVATIIQTALGMAAITVGLVMLLANPMTKRAHLWAKILVFIVNLGPIALVITVVKLVMGAREPPESSNFIPPAMNPTVSDIHMTVAMGILALVSVCTALIGGLTIVGLSLCAYLGGQPVDKHKGYYIIRYAFYNLLVFMGGISQLSLGVYLWIRFGGGPYYEAIHVTTYTVFFPGLSCLVGAFQTFMGIYGWSRALGWIRIHGKSDCRFLYVTWITWIVTMLFQVIVQPSYGRGDSYDAEGATYAAVYIGFFIMPAWLDHVVRNTSSRIDPAEFGLPPCTKCKEDPLCRIFGLTESDPVVIEESQNENDNPLECTQTFRCGHESSIALVNQGSESHTNTRACP